MKQCEGIELLIVPNLLLSPMASIMLTPSVHSTNVSRSYRTFSFGQPSGSVLSMTLKVCSHGCHSSI
ncbi:uncharacterized protein An01g06090 [Aspergillus niger]|uniref:Contig An01c0210, genomic contig n=2 Tax=Aspergillus niger TaxID=5061 RepID=A2Q8Z4_ASPNC|nr:uncharacterized protein An01g06090 [Aspergillus niger]CAK37084.1 unnamed protein product [Aspergillus niger]